MDWLLDNVSVITGLVLSIGVVSYFGGRILTVLKETAELLQVLTKAFADSKLTKEEVDAIIKEAKEVVVAVKDVAKKQE